MVPGPTPTLANPTRTTSPGPSCVAEGERAPDASDRASPFDALVRCAQAGEPWAFRRVAETFGPPLHRYVAGMLRDRSTADDVVQETLVIAWRQIDKVRDGAHLRPWLYRVARNKAISVIRRRVGPVRTHPLESADRTPELAASPGPASPFDADLTDLQRALRIAIARLPDRYAGIVRLHYVHGYTTREAGRVLGIKRSTAKMRLLRARQLLAQYLPQAVAEAGGRARRELADVLESHDALASNSNESGRGHAPPSPTTTKDHDPHSRGDRTSGGVIRPR